MQKITPANSAEMARSAQAMPNASRRALSACPVHHAWTGAARLRSSLAAAGPGVRATHSHDGRHQHGHDHQERIGRQQPRARTAAGGRPLARRRRHGAQQGVEAESQTRQDVDRVEDEKPGRAKEGRRVAETQVDRVEEGGQTGGGEEAGRERDAGAGHRRQGQPVTRQPRRRAAQPAVPDHDRVPGQRQAPAAAASPASHQRLSAALAGPSPLARMAVCAAKKALPSHAASATSATPGVRRSALSSTVSPSQSSRMPLASDSASSGQSNQK